jgi:hypothetical protein
MKSAKLEYNAFPRGACAECLRQWREGGLPGERHELEPGFLLAGYCMHHEAGFYAIVGADFIVREWSIRVPIGIEEWRAYVRLLPGNIAATRAALSDAGNAI